jgi:putative Holliday junction resolvase
VPVETYDERFTTVTARRALRGAGVRAKAQRAAIDKAAAAVMLQAWIDARGAHA